jgi:hypothetical protein
MAPAAGPAGRSLRSAHPRAGSREFDGDRFGPWDGKDPVSSTPRLAEAYPPDQPAARRTSPVGSIDRQPRLRCSSSLTFTIVEEPAQQNGCKNHLAGSTGATRRSHNWRAGRPRRDEVSPGSHKKAGC